jgi:chromosome segregation ATPase
MFLDTLTIKYATKFRPKRNGNMRNRDITKDEINRITEECQPREKAFFTVMRQSGLPPRTIKQLKIKNLERILNPNMPIPCKINVPHEKSRTFIGVEAIKYLKQYLATRTNLTPESLLFTNQNNPKREINTKDVSRAFRLAAQKLEKERKINYEIRKGRPSEIRLYSLIKFYKKNAKYYLTELDNNSIPKDAEFYRKLYEEKAMPFLEIEPPTPMDIHKLRQQQQQQIERRDKEIQELKNSINEIYKKLEEPEIEELPPEYWKQTEKEYKELQKEVKKYGKWPKEHPEEIKKILTRMKELEKKYEKYFEHLEIMEQKELYIKHLGTRIKEIEKKLKELKETIQNQKS